jgi:hypothetical protein
MPRPTSGKHLRTRGRKLGISAIVVGVLGSAAGLGVFGLFSATTQNAGNELSTGTVALTDNDSGSALFNIHGAQPGDSWTRCIKVTYSGSLPADVHVYLANATGPLAAYINVKLWQGTQSASVFPTCDGFVAQAVGPAGDGLLIDGPLISPYPGTYDYALPLVPFGQTAWQPGDSLVIKFAMTLDPNTPDTLQASSTGAMTAVWEARIHS